MATDFRSKFNELFGNEETFTSAPTLRDVVPGLVQGGSQFSSKELNKRRTAVSARNFRNPRVRSMENAFTRQAFEETPKASFVGSPINFDPAGVDGDGGGGGDRPPFPPITSSITSPIDINTPVPGTGPIEENLGRNTIPTQVPMDINTPVGGTGPIGGFDGGPGGSIGSPGAPGEGGVGGYGGGTSGGFGGGGVGDAGDIGDVGDAVSQAGDALGVSIGNSMASNLGTDALGSGIAGGVSALGAGATIGQAAQAGLASGVLGVLGGGMAVAGLANSAIGNAVSANASMSGVESGMSGVTGIGPNQAGMTANAAAQSGFDAAQGTAHGMGALGQLGHSIAVALGLTDQASMSDSVSAAQSGANAAVVGASALGAALDAQKGTFSMTPSAPAAPNQGQTGNHMGTEAQSIANMDSISNAIAQSALSQAVTPSVSSGFGGGSTGGTSPGGSMGPAGTPGAAGMDAGPGGGGACCFTAGTKVQMSDDSTKNIEDVKVGDVVKSYDPATEKYYNCDVISLESPVREGYYEVSFNDESKLNVTNEHPLYSTKGWVSIDPNMTRELDQSGVSVIPMTTGMKLFTLSGLKEITDITYHEGEVQVYTLNHVDIQHTFFVDGVLAHNGK